MTIYGVQAPPPVLKAPENLCERVGIVGQVISATVPFHLIKSAYQSVANAASTKPITIPAANITMSQYQCICIISPPLDGGGQP